MANRGERAAASRLNRAVGEYNLRLKGAAADAVANPGDPHFMKLRQIIEGFVPADPSPAEILAVNWIHAALDHARPMAVRHGTQGSPEHLLDSVDPRLHPEVATQLQRRTNAVAAPPAPPVRPGAVAPQPELVRPQPVQVAPRAS